MSNKTKKVNYFPFFLQPDNLKISLNWLGAPKSVSSFWIKTTPEVEMALYTICFLVSIVTS